MRVRVQCSIRVYMYFELYVYCRVSLSNMRVKGYLRKGAALQVLRRHKEAISAYKVGLEYDPQNSQLQAILKQAEASRRQAKKEKEKQKKKARECRNAASALHSTVSSQILKETYDSLMASDFSDPRTVARIVQQIGAHGTDIKVGFAFSVWTKLLHFPSHHIYHIASPLNGCAQPSQTLCRHVLHDHVSPPRNRFVDPLSIRKMLRTPWAMETRVFCLAKVRRQNICVSFGALEEMSRPCAKVGDWIPSH